MQLGCNQAFYNRPRPWAADGVTVLPWLLPQLRQHYRRMANTNDSWHRTPPWIPSVSFSRQFHPCQAGAGAVGGTSGAINDDNDNDDKRRDGDDASGPQPAVSSPEPAASSGAAVSGQGPVDPPASSSSSPAATDSEPPLTLGSAVLERMAKLRALDQYRTLMSEVTARARKAAAAAAAAAKRGSARGAGGDSSTAAAAPSNTEFDDLDYDSSSLLLRGALLIARHRYPDLDEGKVVGSLEEMGRRVAALLPADPAERYPLRVVAAINRVMYTDYGFRGNEEDYYSADNSCINRVLERRVGIPITLSLVYCEVARRVGLRLRGLNLPGHFMLQPLPRSRTATRRQPSQSQPPPQPPSQPSPQPPQRSDGGASSSAEDPGGAAAAHQDGQGAVDDDEDADEEEGGPLEILIDAFRSGEVCYPAEAEERLSAVLGAPVRIDPSVLRESQPLPARLFLLRMLGNLRSIYLSTQQVDLLLDVLKFMRATLSNEEEEGDGEEGKAPEEASRAASSSSSASAAPAPAAPVPPPYDLDPASRAAAAASLARDEGLAYFALRRYPECLEALREYVRSAERLGGGPLPPEEARTVSVVMEEARRRMTQQQP